MSGALTVYLARFPDQPAVVRLGRIERSTGRRAFTLVIFCQERDRLDLVQSV